MAHQSETHCDAAVDSIFDLVIRNASDLGAVLPAIESRLARLPDYLLIAGAACVNRPVPLWTKLAQRSCEGAASFLLKSKPNCWPIRVRRPAQGA